MKIIQEFRDGLQHVQCDGNDGKYLKKRYQKIAPETFDLLCKWLLENNEVIDLIDKYDPQSGWYGTDFMIRGANLALNGYCLHDKSIIAFVNGEQRKFWYSFWHPKYAEAEQWEIANKK
jgi:hypothetical protein